VKIFSSKKVIQTGLPSGIYFLQLFFEETHPGLISSMPVSTPASISPRPVLVFSGLAFAFSRQASVDSWQAVGLFSTGPHSFKPGIHFGHHLGYELFHDCCQTSGICHD
jgi:hypothetical protein